MARFTDKALPLVLVFCFLALIISTSASRKLSDVSETRTIPPAAAECDSIYGAEAGDTCTSVATDFDLTAETFGGLNPNLNCNAIFVGQWLCVGGSV